jgi:3-methylcrotonyl-CoA carboxylase beta subunit
LIYGYANIWGDKVGILTNNGVLFNDSTLKDAHFIELCNQNETPIVFLQNITGFMIGSEYEQRGITKDGPVATITINREAVMNAVSCETVDRMYDALKRWKMMIRSK